MLRTENLTKTYGRLVAVNDLSIHLESGDIMGFIGPNGAGKTTTIRMLSTLLEPTSGTAYICGVDIFERPEEVRPLIGFMPDSFGLYTDVRVWEYLDFFTSAYRLPMSRRKSTIGEVLELTDLTNKREAFVSELSKGMQQRLCLAKTLLHDPQILFLDEPASGLDPRARIEIKELLKELRKMGKTILISSHILPELADFCNKIAVIEQGKLVASGSVNDIVAQCRGGVLLQIRIAERLDEAMGLLAGIESITDARLEDSTITATYIGEVDGYHEILKKLVLSDFKVLSFNEEDLDLEDVFMKITKGIVS